eukprot:TRINITY_DN8980_c0_g2_i1.p1 TRINITY_DN8980_c0_g2~~TRINITY_DN8980_c0_g2_i1.p1  ORF type:complete len:344 (+),score=57.64 TRINITY_DN8980_c0_g2_i1:141-1172(+)
MAALACCHQGTTDVLCNLSSRQQRPEQCSQSLRLSAPLNLSSTLAAFSERKECCRRKGCFSFSCSSQSSPSERSPSPIGRSSGETDGFGNPNPFPRPVSASHGNGVSASASPYSVGVSLQERSVPVVSEGVRTAENLIERMIFDCRFFTLMAVAGSMCGSFLCFMKGCLLVVEACQEYYHLCWKGFGTGKVILLLVEAVDTYLIGTVMLIFGMGLYELFVSPIKLPLANAAAGSARRAVCNSNFFGLFILKERPRWLEITSLDELKTKLGHVIVMILLVGMFEKSKKVHVASAAELLFFSLSVLMSSGCLYLLSKLHGPKSPTSTALKSHDEGMNHNGSAAHA